MTRLPQSNFVQGGYYHIFNRGNRSQDIFLDTKDYKKYLEKLKEYKKRHNITILAYCLMPNHIHLLIRQNSPDPVSNFIQRIHTSYTMYLNGKHKTTGHVFEGRFKVKVVGRDDYLAELSRYIHTNPSKLVTRLPAYKWSSYPSYLKEVGDDLTDTSKILSQFKRKNQTTTDATRQYQEFVKSKSPTPEKIKDLTFKH